MAGNAYAYVRLIIDLDSGAGLVLIDFLMAQTSLGGYWGGIDPLSVGKGIHR